MNKYTCVDYRTEMILLGLLRRLHHEELTDGERSSLLAEIETIETDIELD